MAKKEAAATSEDRAEGGDGRYGRPKAIVTDRLRSYRAAMQAIGNERLQETGRWINNRAENSHLPFRRRERTMQRFRRMRSLQKFAAVHSSFLNHFNHERHLTSRMLRAEEIAAGLVPDRDPSWWEDELEAMLERLGYTAVDPANFRNV